MIKCAWEKLLNSDASQPASSAVASASPHIIRQTHQRYLLSTAGGGRSDTEGSLDKASDVGGQIEKVESLLTLGGINAMRNKSTTVPKVVGLWRTLSGFLTDRRENGLPLGDEFSFFTHSVNSVTAAFGASWHHGWIQQLKDTARCLPRPIFSP